MIPLSWQPGGGQARARPAPARRGRAGGGGGGGGGVDCAPRGTSARRRTSAMKRLKEPGPRSLPSQPSLASPRKKCRLVQTSFLGDPPNSLGGSQNHGFLTPASTSPLLWACCCESETVSLTFSDKLGLLEIAPESFGLRVTYTTRPRPPSAPSVSDAGRNLIRAARRARGHGSGHPVAVQAGNPAPLYL